MIAMFIEMNCSVVWSLSVRVVCEWECKLGSRLGSKLG